MSNQPKLVLVSAGELVHIILDGKKPRYVHIYSDDGTPVSEGVMCEGILYTADADIEKKMKECQKIK